MKHIIIQHDMQFCSKGDEVTVTSKSGKEFIGTFAGVKNIWEDGYPTGEQDANIIINDQYVRIKLRG